MKIAILTGGNGMLAYALQQHLVKAGYRVIALTHAQLDITSRPEIERIFEQHYPVSIVFNCAAMTQVDACETQVTQAFEINALGPENLAKVCHNMSIPLVHFSTDYVFDGTQDTPYSEADVTHPINVYGRSKLAGEEAILGSGCESYIFRLQWLYGEHGRHFVGIMTQKLQEGQPVYVVNDQWGSPSWTQDIAKSVVTAIEASLPYGLYHLANQGVTSWFGLTERIRDLLALSTPVLPVPSQDFPRPAPRPLHSALSIERFKLACPTAVPLGWEAALQGFLPLHCHPPKSPL